MTGKRQTPAWVRALRVELAKLRRARVLVSVLAMPAGLVALKVAVFVLRGEDGLGADRYSFAYLFSIGQFFWDRLLVPLLAVTFCAWLFWLEDESGHWKVLLTQPVPRGAVYLSKLGVACGMLALLQFLWWILHSLAGLSLGLHGSETIGAAGLHALRVASALTAVIGVQSLLSALLRSPFASLAIGVVGNTASLVLSGTAINNWHPWGLAQVAGQASAAPWAMWAACGAAAALSWIGVTRFARKEV